MKHAKSEEVKSPREDWPPGRPSGQILYTDEYNTELLRNHSEVNKSERDIKDGGGPYGDRRRRKRRGVREVNNEGEGSYREIKYTVVIVQRREREAQGETRHVGQVYIRRESVNNGSKGDRRLHS